MLALDRRVDASVYGIAGSIVTKALRPITAGSLGAVGLNPGLGVSANPGRNAKLAPSPPSAHSGLSTLQGGVSTAPQAASRASPSNPFSQQQLARATRELLDPFLNERDEEFHAKRDQQPHARQGDKSKEPFVDGEPKRFEQSSPDTYTNDTLPFDVTNFKSTDALSDSAYTRHVKKITRDGLQNPLIKYVTIEGTPYIVHGNNRFLAALRLNILDQLQFIEVSTPVEGTNFQTKQDIVAASIAVRRPKFRGR